MSGGQSANPFLEALRIRRKLAFHIFLGVMLILAAGAFLTLQYSASAVVALDPHSLSNEADGRAENPVDLAWTALPDKQIQTIIQQFQLNSGITHLRAHNRIFTYVRSNISFHQLSSGGSGMPAILQVSFVGSQPATAVDVANAVAQSLAHPSLGHPTPAQPMTAGAQPGSALSPKDLADEIQKVRTTLQLLSQTNSTPISQDELQKYFRTDAKLQAERKATVIELAALDQQAAQAANAAAKTKAMMAARPEPPPPSNPAAIALEGQIRQAQAYLAQLRQRYTDEYPAVQEARQALAGLEDKLHRIPVEKPRPRPAVQASGPTPEQARIMAARDQVLERQQGLDEAISVNQNQADLVRQRIDRSKTSAQDYAFEQQRYQALLKQQQAESNGGAGEAVEPAGGAAAVTGGAAAAAGGAVAAIDGAAAPRFIIIQRAAGATADGFAVNPLFWIYGVIAAFLIACFFAFIAEQFNPAAENDPTPRSLHLNIK